MKFGWWGLLNWCFPSIEQKRDLMFGSGEEKSNWGTET